jgi:CheY-like chemotaxis protein
MTILLIEDSRFLRKAIERALTRAGHDVTGVADGLEGLRVARATLPALILLDMMLPGLDGTAVLKALKQDAVSAQIPVIVLTGLSQKNEATLKNAGASAYIEKASLDLNHDATVLIQAIDRVFGGLVALGGTNPRCAASPLPADCTDGH